MGIVDFSSDVLFTNMMDMTFDRLICDSCVESAKSHLGEDE